MSFNEQLYRYRKAKGLSQEELAGKINVSRQTVSKWELGDSAPDMEKLINLAEIFGVSLDELVNGNKFEDNDKEKEEMKVPQADNGRQKIMLTEENKVKGKRLLKCMIIVFGILLALDFISFLVYIMLYGFPK